MSKPIEWSKKENMYFSDNRFEFSIFKNDNFWILSYTDSWTTGNFFLVNIKNSSEEMIAIPRLKKYAEEVIAYRKTKETNIKIEL